MINSPFSPWPSFTKDEALAVQKVLLSNKVNYWTGEECRKFENEFANFSQSKYAIALSNGTVALEAALISLGIGKGDEVIVTPRSYIASASSVVNVGAIPVFADINPNTQNIDVEKVPNLISKKTKAIICVHLAGWPCEMDSLIKVARVHKLKLIEDCAQAHGSLYKGKSVGSIGDIGCWSFCQDKIMTTGGEGGMITTNSKKIWRKIWEYKDHGKSYSQTNKKINKPGFRWLHNTFGTNWRMTEMQAVIGRLQLKKMNQWTELRNRNQGLIWNFCKKIVGLRVPDFPNDDNSVHAAYKCYVFIDKSKLKKNWTRDRIMAEINNKGVPCFSGSCAEIYLEKAFRKNNLGPKERLKCAKKIGEESLMFLIHPTLNKSEINKTNDAIKSVMLLAANTD